MKISRFGKWLGTSVIVLAVLIGGKIVLAQNAKEGRPCYRDDQCASKSCLCDADGTYKAEDGSCVTCPTGSTMTKVGNKVQCVKDGGGTVQVKIFSGVCAGGGSVTDQDNTVTADVPVEKMREVSEGHITEMRGVLERVVEVQGIARKQQDVLKLNCVNDKLLQIKQYLNIAEKALTDMIEAIAGDDTQSAYDRLSDITIAWEETVRLGAEAEQCIGTDLSYLGPSDTTYEGGDEPDDPTKTDEPDFPEVEPLPPASQMK